MIRYEIKQIKMFKGFEKVSDIQYIYTPFDSSLCGVRLEANSQKQYLLTGQVLSDGKVFIHLCNYIEPWENLSFLQRESLNHHYHLNCGCQVRERPFPRSPPAIQCPAPSRPPTSASGQTGCWNGSSMGTRPSIMSARSMLTAPAAGTRDICPSGRSLLTSSSLRRDCHIPSRVLKTKPFSFSAEVWLSPSASSLPASRKYQVAGLASFRAGVGRIKACV
nr:metalloproteinase inhibitor 4 isoform X3 [Camelus dromedarius]XP_031326781.1 metalloproteinase inhibitor 4 isoform X3 [Camelus dromedarius]